jgi:hypothetical protein
MSTLGKVLAALNILGVGGLIYLFSVTYAKRQQWEYANFRHDLIVDGLPIDDEDRDREGEPLVNKFESDPTKFSKDRTLKELFPGSPVRTQRAEVERVKQQLDAKLAKATNDRKKAIQLADIVMPLVGAYRRHEIYADREFYLSLKAQLEDDKNFAEFKKTLAQAIPIAATAVRFKDDKTNKRTSFEKAFQQALNDLPGDDKWKLAEVFLSKLPQEGASWDDAAVAADKAASDVETKLKAVPEALAALDKAKSDAFVARAEYLADSNNAAKKKDMDDKEQVRQREQEKYNDVKKTADDLPKPRDAAAVALLQAIRKAKDKKTVTAFVDEGVERALEDVIAELTRLYDEAYNEAANGQFAGAEGSGSKSLIRDRRRQAIARFLFTALEVLDDQNSNDFGAFRDGEKPGGGKITSMIDLASFKRFVNVVGVEYAVKAVNAQEESLRGVIGDLTGLIKHERNVFADRHNEIVLALKTRAGEIDRLAARLQDITKQATAQEKIAADELTRVNKYVDDLTQSRVETAGRMTELTKLTDGLDHVRKDIRDAIRANDRNLRKIADLEYEILYLQQKLAEKEKAEKDKKRNRVAP